MRFLLKSVLMGLVLLALVATGCGGEEGRTHISPRHRSGSCPGYTDSDATDSDTDNATPTDGRTDQSASDASADLGHA